MTETPRSTVRDQLSDAAFIATPVVPTRSPTDLTAIVDGTPYTIRCCTGRRQPEGLYFTAPETELVDLVAVVTEEETYMVDTRGLDAGCTTIVSPAGNGVWGVAEWLGSR